MMMRGALGGGIFTMLWVGTLACAASPTPSATAEQLLRAKLTTAYPAVERWDIEPLALARATDAIPESAPAAGASAQGAPRVVQLGARSAVWLPGAATDAARGKLVWFTVAGFAKTLVATRELPARTPLAAADAGVAERDLLSVDCEPVHETTALAGTRARRTLRSGEILCANLLEAVPQVFRGQQIIVRYVGQSFVLTARGISQADAALGNAVLVRNSSSGEMLSGTVSGTGEVQVHE